MVLKHGRSLRGLSFPTLAVLAALPVLSGGALSAQGLAPFCVPSSTVLCLDDTPGDRRFQVTATYHTVQAGGLSGQGHAVQLAPVGLTRGGLFWFFSPDNPEVLVKVLNGCAVTNHFWVYISAGTNVGFDVTVSDTDFFGMMKTYTNPDLTPAPPIQDVAALASCEVCASDSECPTGLICCRKTGGNVCTFPASDGTCPQIP
ncbi:MAG TPA: hypothetical protein VGM86_32660 [Thermoanaerobaculia bacterium]|jgi:hypothetical protein